MAKHGSCVSRRYLRIRRTLGSVRCASKDRPDLQWCLAPDMIKPALLGRNGHPRSGIIRPNLGLRRRMWAGGRVEWHCGMFPGESITQRSVISHTRKVAQVGWGLSHVSISTFVMTNYASMRCKTLSSTLNPPLMHYPYHHHWSLLG